MENKHFFEDEINFLEVLKNPVRWFGIIYPYFLVIIILGGVFYYNHMSRAYRNTVPPSVADSANVFSDIQPVKGSVSEGININEISDASQDLINQGENLYKANCVSCHGEQGMGDGAAGQVLNPKPRNFHSTEGWVNGRDFASMFTTVTEGIISSGMPAYNHLPAMDRVALVHYVRTFTNFPQISEQELTQLDQKYSLREGSVIPSQIPVSTAMEKISEEQLPEVREIYSIVSYINNNSNNPGAKLLNEVGKDKIRIVSFLTASNQWRGSIEDFIKSISLTIKTNGFRIEVLSLSRGQWSELYNYLIEVMPYKKAA